MVLKRSPTRSPNYALYLLFSPIYQFVAEATGVLLLELLGVGGHVRVGEGGGRGHRQRQRQPAKPHRETGKHWRRGGPQARAYIRHVPAAIACDGQFMPDGVPGPDPSDK